MTLDFMTAFLEMSYIAITELIAVLLGLLHYDTTFVLIYGWSHIAVHTLSTCSRSKLLMMSWSTL